MSSYLTKSEKHFDFLKNPNFGVLTCNSRTGDDLDPKSLCRQKFRVETEKNILGTFEIFAILAQTLAHAKKAVCEKCLSVIPATNVADLEIMPTKSVPYFKRFLANTFNVLGQKISTD